MCLSDCDNLPFVCSFFLPLFSNHIPLSACDNLPSDAGFFFCSGYVALLYWGFSRSCLLAYIVCFRLCLDRSHAWSSLCILAPAMGSCHPNQHSRSFNRISQIISKVRFFSRLTPSSYLHMPNFTLSWFPLTKPMRIYTLVVW